MDRKAELAKKKKQLEELKKKREGALAANTKADEANIDVSELVDSLLTPNTANPTPESPVRVPAMSNRLRIRARATLSNSEVKHVDVTPTEMVTYEKQCQTNPLPELEKPVQKDPKEAEEQKKAQAASEAKKEVKKEETKEKKPEEKKEKKPQILTDQQADRFLKSQDFVSFFERTSRIVERALNEPYDVAVDYTQDTANEQDMVGSLSAKLHLTYYSERWTAGRAVTCLDWSPKFPELCAAAYNANPDAPNDPDGLVLVWNTHLPDTPESIFHCQSAVLSTCFSPYNPHILVGGTYSGQIVLWDNRTKKRTPVNRSSLGAKSHAHPVYCMNVVGTQNAHNLITLSTYGKQCSWNLDTLTEPQESLELQSGNAKNVAAMCMSFPVGDINNFVVGSEDTCLYQCSRHGGKSGVGEMYEGHTGPITGVDFHSGSGSADFSHLFLSSSTDWTVKLWSNKSKSPIISFEDANDYVYDVQWSPVHPALFVTGDGAGHLDFWNINNDTEIPTLRVVAGAGEGKQTGEGKHAVNRVKWNRAGTHLAAGDADGHVYLYDVGEKLAMPRADESARLKATLQEILASAAESKNPASSSLH